jgi:signal transduction histidine kinase
MQGNTGWKDINKQCVGMMKLPAALDMAQLEHLQETLEWLPAPAWLYDARGRLRAVNAATLRLFDVPDYAAFVAQAGGTLAEQMQRLRPRLASPAVIARATEESIYSFTPDRARFDGSEPAWGSARRRERSAVLRQDEMPVARALKKRPAPELLISLQHPAREAEIIVRASAAPMIENDRVSGAIMLTIDYTNEMLRDGRRDAILALAGHDIRNPLTPARGLLQQLRIRLAREGDRFTKEMEYIDRVLAQLDRIKQIAADLDAIAVTNRGDATASMASCDLVALCRSVTQRQMEHNPQVPVIVKTNAKEMKGVWSALHLERALVMLVDSAVRRTPPGRAVTIRLKQQRNQFKVEIADQGTGVATEHLEALRDVLSRGGAALALTHGWDLDLSTVQTMLALNGSRLNIANSTRGGTMLWFALPAPLPDPEY